jgi:integrase
LPAPVSAESCRKWLDPALKHDTGLTLHMKRKPSRRLNFTRRALASLPVPQGDDRVIVFDTNTPGLGFVVFPSGVRSFFHRRFANGVAERTTIGRFEDFAIDQARGKAAELNAKLAQWKLADFEGPNPLANAERAQATFGELLEAYIRGHLKLNANDPERAEGDLRWMAKKYFDAWTSRRIDSIRIEDVLALRNKIGLAHRYQANRLVQTVKALFSWSAGRKDGKVNFWPVANPARDIELYPEEKRRRFLQPEELVKFNHELKKEVHRDLHDFLILALATGARKSNVFAMRWTDISFERANWRVPFSKSGEGYDVALTPAAIKVIRRRRGESPDDAEFVFPSHGKSGHLVDLKKQWYAFRERAGIPDVRIHDIRRSRGSYLAIAGVSLQQIGAVLGHRSLGSTEIYARLHQESLRQAIESGDAVMQRMTKQAKKRLKLAGGGQILPVGAPKKQKQLKAGRQ